MRRLPGLIVALSAVLLAGTRPGLAQSPWRVSVRSEQFELALSVPRAEYAAGETVSVAMSLRNVAPGPVTFMPAAVRLFDFAVYDAAGRHLGTSTGGNFPLALPRPLTLQAGEAIEETLAWDLTLPGPDGRRPLPLGRYALEGFLLGSRDQPGGWVFPRPVVTPRLSITVH